MRRIILQNMISLDGFFAGVDGDLSWHHVDKEFNEYAVPFLDSVDTLLFGRVTYELMYAYWPTAHAIANDPDVARRMNSLKKIVFSKTMNTASWNNTRLIKENIPWEIKNMKEQQGKDIAIAGSSDLAVTLMEHGLIDEFRIIVNPVLLAQGKRLFEGMAGKMNLKLTGTKIFGSGNVLLQYEPRKE